MLAAINPVDDLGPRVSAVIKVERQVQFVTERLLAGRRFQRLCTGHDRHQQNQQERSAIEDTERFNGGQAHRCSSSVVSSVVHGNGSETITRRITSSRATLSTTSIPRMT